LASGPDGPVIATPAVTANNALLNVAGSSAIDAWAVGDSPLGYHSSVPVLLHWNGSAWSPVAQPAASGALTAVADLGTGNAWAVGRAQLNGSALAPGGTVNWAVGTGTGAFVLARTN
jgi:hypothetical protein